MAALAASLANDGPAKSGNPWPRLTAPYWLANRLISVNTEVPKLRTRGEATSRVRRADLSAAHPSLELPDFRSETDLRPTSPRGTFIFSLRLRPVLTKYRTQRVANLAERCSGAQRVSHRRQKVSSRIGR